MSVHYTTVWNGFVWRCCDARAVVAAVYEMLLLSSVTLPSARTYSNSVRFWRNSVKNVILLKQALFDQEPGYEASCTCARNNH